MDGAVAYADAMQIDPASTDAANAGILARRRYVAAGFWYGARLPAGSANDAEHRDAPCEEGTLVAFAQSTPDLVYLRALGDDAPAIDAVLRQSVERVSDGWRLPAVHLNRFHC